MFTGQAWFPEYELELCRAYGVPNLGLGAFRGENLSEAAVNDIVIERHNQAAIEAARESFTAASRRAGIKAEPLTVSASLVSAGDQFGQIARRFDLAVVGQPEPEANAVEEIIVEGALFDSGRPVLIVPYIQKAPLKLDRVMVCWDGGRAAARAIGDAIPFLERAGRIEVVIVTNERGKQDQIERADIGAHLARHGLNAKIKRMPPGDIDVADVLPSYAADEGVDFHRDGRLRLRALARIRPWRRHSQHVAHNDGADVNVALSGICELTSLDFVVA